MIFSMEMLCFVRQISGFSHKGIMDFVFPISKFNMYIKLSLACTYMITENISGLLSLIYRSLHSLRSIKNILGGGGGNIWVLTAVSKKTNKHITYTEYLSHEVIYNWIVLNLCKLPCCSEDTGKPQCIRRV